MADLAREAGYHRFVRHAPLLIRLAAVTAAYVVAGRAGLSLASVHASASPVWPAAGIAVAALLLGGFRLWPAIAAGAFLVNVLTSGHAGASFGITVGNTLEAVMSAWAIGRFAGGARAFEDTGRAVRASALMTACAAIAATLGTSSLVLAGLAETRSWDVLWLTWWLGDATGMVIVGALVLLWAPSPRLDTIRSCPIEAASALAAVVAVTVLVFSPWTMIGGGQYSLTWLCLPVLLWPAFRFGPRESAAATAICAAVAIYFTVGNSGPFAPLDPNRSLLLLQLFLAITVVVTIATAVEASERRRRQAELAALNDELERHVGRRTADLQRAQARLIEAQAVAHIGSWEWEIGTNRVWWSDEMYRIYGLDPAAFTASYEGFLQYVHPDDLGMVRQEVEAAVGNRQCWSFEHRIVRGGDGQIRTLLASGDTVTDAEGRAARLRGTAQDITERLRAEEARAALAREHTARVEAEDANRLKDQFIATLSHELRTPLNAVMGWAHMLLHGALDDVGRERALEAIYRNAVIQSQLVSDMLDVSRIAAGTMVLNVGLIDLPAIVETTIEGARPAAGAKDVAIERTIDETAWVYGDGKRLAQVMNNLLSNAIKFTPEGGRVGVTITKNEHDVIMQVEDSGPGMPPEFLAYAFERFRQADPSVTRTHGGLGIGLSIVRHIVELHGGTVEAANRADTSGAVVTVRLPIQAR
jgi:PAS domain S-box-containing protein